MSSLETLASRLEGEAVLLPCADLGVLSLAQGQAQVDPRYLLALPEVEVVENLVSKVKFQACAEKVGIPVPKSGVLISRDDALRVGESLQFPVFLKPDVKSQAWKTHSKDKVVKVDSPEELLVLFDRFSRWMDCLVVQESVEGGDENHYTCNCYLDRGGEELVSFVSRKLRQWPPGVGTGSLSVSCPNETVREMTLSFFRLIGYWGLGYAEIKRDYRTGDYFILETNVGRPTGRSSLAEAAGVELLMTLYCHLTGRPVPANRVQGQNEVKWVYLRKDLQACLYLAKRGDLGIREWWNSTKGPKTYALLSLRDPIPFLLDVWKTVVKALAALSGRRNEGGK
jgi:predicted ATP-grasp superfamily ATP-dependent carboligase